MGSGDNRGHIRSITPSYHVANECTQQETCLDDKSTIVAAAEADLVARQLASRLMAGMLAEMLQLVSGEM